MEEQTKIKSTSDIKSSEEIGKLVLALSKAQSGFDKAYKTTGNPFFNSKYADLATIIASTREHLCENELAIMQFAEGNHLKVSVTTKLCHSSGEWFESKIEAVPKKPDCQQQGSVITYLRRYSMSAILGIAQEDDDANSQIHPDLIKIKNFYDYNPISKALILSKYKSILSIPEEDYKNLLVKLYNNGTKPVQEAQQVTNDPTLLGKKQIATLQSKIDLLKDKSVLKAMLDVYEVSGINQIKKDKYDEIIKVYDKRLEMKRGAKQ